MRITPINYNSNNRSFGKMTINKSAKNVLDNMSKKELKEINNFQNELNNTKFYDVEISSYEQNKLFIILYNKEKGNMATEIPFYDVKQDGSQIIAKTIDIYEPVDKIYEVLDFENPKKAQEVLTDLNKSEKEYLKTQNEFKFIEWAVKCVKYLEESKRAQN